MLGTMMGLPAPSERKDQSAAGRLYREFLREESWPEVVRLIEGLRAHRERIEREWYELCLPSLGVTEPLARQFFQDLHVSSVESVIEYLSRGDGAGLVTFA